MGNAPTLLEELAYPFQSPDSYFHRFDPATADLVFIRMNREAFAKSTFLDDRVHRLDRQEARVPFSVLWSHYRDIEPEVSSAAIVFHTAYCGSTLLAKALDVVPSLLVLREPAALLQLALGVVTPPKGHSTADLLELACALYSRTYSDHPSRVVVKVSSLCAVLGEDLVRAGRSVLLYADLKDSILSHVKHPSRIREARLFFPAFTGSLVGEPLADVGFSDAQVIAINWAFLVKSLGVGTALKHAARVPKERLLAAPADTISSVLSALELPALDDLAMRLSKAQTFSRHSKSSGDSQKEFDAGAREEALLNLAQKHAAELEGIECWLDTWLADVSQNYR